MSLKPFSLLLVAAALSLAFAACSDNGEPSTATPAATEGVPTTATPAPPTATATESATASPAPGEAPNSALTIDDLTPNVANVVTHVAMLAGEIGIRAAGTEGERTAATYIAGLLEDAGYEATIEPFPITTRDDGSTIEVDGAAVVTRPFMMNGSATAEVSGAMVFGGLGSAADLASLDVDGRVLLLDRGVLSFRDKVRNAELAGAAAVIVANNEAGLYNGNLGDRPATIPVLAISRAEGDLLRPFADDATIVDVSASIDTIEVESQNVVGRSGDVCRFYIGGHHDSVPAGPGANDNASGTALMLELARVHRVDGLCVVAFGAEEIGLFGSQAHVATHGVADVLFMLNFDMAGRLDNALVIGDRALSGLVLAAVDDLPIRGGQFPPFASSDHVSFLDAGVPAVTITSGDDPLIHSAGDTVDNVSVDALRTMLEVGTRALTAALAAAG